MDLIPSTPPGSPAFAPPLTQIPLWKPAVAWVRRVIANIANFVAERQDASGAVTLLAFLGSSLSASLGLFAVFLATNGYPAFYPVLAWITRHAGRALWGLAVGAGFMSDRRLPRLLAWSVVLEAVVFYSWDRFGSPGGFYPWNMRLHIGLGLLLAAPAALAWARRRSGPDAP